MMKTIATKLETIIEGYFPQLKTISESEYVYKASPVKWSKKELMGHLIDSAQNNLRRFVVAQYEENAAIMYNQDKWVAINDYQHQPLQDILLLWYLMNRQIVFILKNTPDKMGQCISQSDALHTIEWLATDYVKHLAHHLHQVLNLEPVAYP